MSDSDADGDPVRQLLLSDPARALRQWCKCGHSQAAHGDRAAPNHGPCLVVNCPCTKYTWTAHSPDDTNDPLRRRCYHCDAPAVTSWHGIPLCRYHHQGARP